jgi:hypothetical protein
MFAWDGESVGDPVPGFSALFLDQANAFDAHATVDGLAHVVNREQADGKVLIYLVFQNSVFSVLTPFSPLSGIKMG